MGLRSRIKERKQDKTGSLAASPPAQAAFSVGANVQLTAHTAVFPAGTTGEVISVTTDGRTPIYQVEMHASNKNPVDIPEKQLKQVIDGQGVFEVGTRVRLTEEVIVEAPEPHLAADIDTAFARSGGVKGDQAGDAELSYEKGTTGTVIMQPEGYEEHVIRLDLYPKDFDLVVHTTKLERIHGAAEVIPNPEENLDVHRLFAYLDRVVLTWNVEIQTGQKYAKGHSGVIYPMDPQISIAEAMDESWRRHVYTVRFGDFPRPSDNFVLVEVPARKLQLETDLNP